MPRPGERPRRGDCGAFASDAVAVAVASEASEDAEEELDCLLSSDGGVGCGSRGIWKCRAYAADIERVAFDRDGPAIELGMVVVVVVRWTTM